MSDLRGFLERLEREGEVLHIEEEASPRFEIPLLLRAFDGDKALLFERVEGYGNRVVGGICGSRRRILEALGLTPSSFYEQLIQAIRKPKPCVVGDGPVMEVMEPPSLNKIPILTHFERDPGPYITAGVLYAGIPDGSTGNVSFHRLLVLDERRMTLRIVPRHLYRIVQMARERGLTSLDVSISIGLHPAVMVAAASPAPFGVCEFEVANSLLGGGLRLIECEHVDALAPADAELVLEGRLHLDEEALEGPFVDLSGTYDIERRQPVVEVVGVMHREDYIYQALLPSGSEHKLLMGMPPEARIWEYARGVVPTVREVNMTRGGCGWLHCVVSLEKFREGDPKNVLMAIFAAHPSLKLAVVVDSDIDPYDMEQVEWAIATRFRGDEDLLVIPHVRVSSLDPTSDQELELGCKVGIDATRPLTKPQEKFEKARIPISDRAKRLLQRYGQEGGRKSCT
ncbi:MAG: UbiD family decarboxylase [Candidatus Bathyarchaeia archaeon]|nr:UbiD family decarboxylase [Candidatus Bathyarchaeota archaeon]